MIKQITIALSIVTCLISLISTNLSYSSSYQNLTINNVLTNSEFVFQGKVINVLYKIPQDRDGIYTYVKFEINDIIKGSYNANTIELRFPGGVYEGKVESVSNMVIPKLNEEGIYFVNSLSKHYVSPLTGWSQGHIKIYTDRSGEKRIFSVKNVPITGISSAQTRSRTTNENLAADHAIGVKTSNKLDSAISANEFKKQLKAIKSE